MLRNDYPEKRDFIRMSINSRVKFQIQGSKEMHDGRISDLSGSGMSVTSTISLNADTRLAVAVESSSRSIPPLVANVIVVRCDPNPDSDDFTLACKIDRIHPAEYSGSST